MAAEDTVSQVVKDPAVTQSAEQQALTQQRLKEAYDTTMNALYLSAFSFILGVLVTVLLLLILDFMRRVAGEAEEP